MYFHLLRTYLYKYINFGSKYKQSHGIYFDVMNFSVQEVWE